MLAFPHHPSTGGRTIPTTNITLAPTEASFITDALLDRAADAHNDYDPERAEALARLALRVDPYQRVEAHRLYAGRTDVTNVVYVDSVQGAEVRYTRKGITGHSFLRLFNETFRKVNIHDA